jgi:Zn-dependent peptidase ImmA (M78 family)
MPRATAVPITPSVMTWAISESGYPLDELAAATGVSPGTIKLWQAGESQPSLTQLRALASKVKRPLAAFLLPRPPQLPLPPLEFRGPPGEQRSRLNPDERRGVRDAARLQRVLSWILGELGRPKLEVPRVSIKAAIDREAADAAARIGVAAEAQVQWPTPHAAFHKWRAALERSGVFVLTLPMGTDACRGFSLWDDRAPLIAVNTAWSAEARIFTLFHEYGHLLTRTNSACREGTYRRTNAQSDTVERWCEQFAAAVILPLRQLQRFLTEHGWQRRVAEVEAVRKVARHFKASLRATTLRLIGMGVAEWELYASLPPTADRRSPGGGGTGRERAHVRHDQYGAHTMQLFRAALQHDVIGRGDVLDYLDLPPLALSASRGHEPPTAETE